MRSGIFGDVSAVIGGKHTELRGAVLLRSLLTACPTPETDPDTKKDRRSTHRSPINGQHPEGDETYIRRPSLLSHLPFWVNTFTGSTKGAAGTSFTRFFGIGRSAGAGCD